MQVLVELFFAEQVLYDLTFDFNIVLAEFRGHGYGGVLMDWAMETFRALGVSRIEVKVVDGNAAALRLYEEYGFKMNAHILVRLG